MNIIDEAQVEAILASGLGKIGPAGKRILALVPDRTRTAPVGRMVKALHRILHDLGAELDVMVALGTHPPLSREAMLNHLDLSEEAYAASYADMGLFNHRWDDDESLTAIGEIPADLISQLTDGLMAETVKIRVNRMALTYDHILILGPVFPHEVAGFSGGNKYLFPGISGPEFIDFFHWLGAVITNLKIIGVMDNPVRRVLDQAAALMPVPVSNISLVVHEGDLVGLYVGSPIESWRQAVAESAKQHVVYKRRTFKRVLSCAPLMYEDLWTGGKCMYKLEPVVADGGELIIYAPHISSLSLTHGHIIEKIGYHVRDYYFKQPERFADIPKAVMAVSTYIRGSGVYENGLEKPRINVSLATGIPQEVCEKVGLRYVDPAGIDFSEWRSREEDGILLVEKAGEILYLPRASLSDRRVSYEGNTSSRS